MCQTRLLFHVGWNYTAIITFARKIFWLLISSKDHLRFSIIVISFTKSKFWFTSNTSAKTSKSYENLSNLWLSSYFTAHIRSDLVLSVTHISPSKFKSLYARQIMYSIIHFKLNYCFIKIMMNTCYSWHCFSLGSFLDILCPCLRIARIDGIYNKNMHQII